MNVILATALAVGIIILYDQLPPKWKPAVTMFLATLIMGMLIGNYKKIKEQLSYVFFGRKE